jgi:hypothetical protein
MFTSPLEYNANEFKHICLGTRFARILTELLLKVGLTVGDKTQKNRL